MQLRAGHVSRQYMHRLLTWPWASVGGFQHEIVNTRGALGNVLQDGVGGDVPRWADNLHDGFPIAVSVRS